MFDYISPEEVAQRRGLRMVVVGNVPSPWGEAAKGILHTKNIPWSAVRLSYDSEVIAAAIISAAESPPSIFTAPRSWRCSSHFHKRCARWTPKYEPRSRRSTRRRRQHSTQFSSKAP